MRILQSQMDFQKYDASALRKELVDLQVLQFQLSKQMYTKINYR